MVKFKTLKEATPAPAPVKQAEPTQAAPAKPAAAPAPAQDQTLTQATEAIKQIVMPVVAQAIQDYLQKNLPALIQNALKAQKQPEPAPVAEKPAAQQPAAKTTPPKA